jgi:hypothetical protein
MMVVIRYGWDPKVFQTKVSQMLSFVKEPLTWRAATSILKKAAWKASGEGKLVFVEDILPMESK